jgi:hypothetical protein
MGKQFINKQKVMVTIFSSLLGTHLLTMRIE